MSPNRGAVLLRFDWDAEKDRSNEAKHGVAFSEAATAFGDALSITVPDPDHSVGEARFLPVGLTYLGRLVVVSHVETKESISIISARLASRRERRTYEEEA